MTMNSILELQLPNFTIANMEQPQLHVTNFISSEFVEADLFLPSFEPATGKVWAMVQDSTPEDVEQAVQAAESAFPSWSTFPPVERSRILHRLANLLEERLEEFAVAEARDQGKPVSLARNVEIPRAVLNFRHFASTFPNILNGSAVQPESNAISYTVRNPVGIAALISPWNLPLYLLTFKMAPALMAGNTIVCKPSEMTSVTAWMLCPLLNEAGVPPGVVNMVFGTGPKAGEALVLHSKVRIISFTGSTAVGARIASHVAPHFKKVSLEMGGKNAGVVFEDADLTKCVPETVRSAFTNQGEVCLTTSRIFVEESIFDLFVDLYVSETKKLRVGPSLRDGISVGALISKEHLTKVRNYVEIAKKKGATVLCGHCRDQFDNPEGYENGYYMLPTVITNVSDTSPCMQEEIFGPVVCISSFKTEAEVVRRMNHVKYGLCGVVWTKDAGRLHRVAHNLEVGTVWGNCWLVRNLNMPFGGVKRSGVGREGTRDSYEFYTESKTICVKLD